MLAVFSLSNQRKEFYPNHEKGSVAASVTYRLQTNRRKKKDFQRKKQLACSSDLLPIIVAIKESYSFQKDTQKKIDIKSYERSEIFLFLMTNIYFSSHQS